MFARSTTIMGNPEAIDAGINYVRDEAMDACLALDGCVGLSMLVDRESGQCIVTTSWETNEAMRASDLHLRPLRARGGEIVGGTPSVEEWEVAAMRRIHMTGEGTCCRATWMRTKSADVDRGIDIYRFAMLPALERFEGFCSASLLVNREDRRACSTVSFDSKEAMESTRDQGWAIRNPGIRDAGVDLIRVAEYELVLAHLRVPEMV